MAGVLDGLLVVALEQAVAAPFCSARLADAGARVIKVERPGGDFARSYDAAVHGESAYFVWLNRGKESICLDIKQPGDRDVLLRMLAQADVFIQNLAPGACSRLGIDPEVLRARHPRLITVDISGYGDAGPYRDMKAYDLLVQCESGLASITGAPDAPGRVGVSICDIACGMYAHAAVLEALIQRGRTGRGCALRVSLFDAVAEWMTVPLLHQEYAGTAPERIGLRHPSIAPYGAYACGEGGQVAIAVQNEREWQRFCEQVLQRPELAADPAFDSNVARCANRAELDAQIGTVFLALSESQLRARLRAGGIAFGSVNTVAGLSNHPQLRRVTVATPSGPAALVAPPARGVDARTGPVPALDQHGADLRAEFAA